MPDKLSRKTIKCPECGLKVPRLYLKEAGVGTNEIPAADYAKQCRLVSERAAFDFNCPRLQAAINAAMRQEGRLGQQ
jgi:hypothetical protein